MFDILLKTKLDLAKMNFPTEKVQWYYQPAKWWHLRYRGGSWVGYFKYLKDRDLDAIRPGLPNLGYPVKMTTHGYHLDEMADRFCTELRFSFRRSSDAVQFKLSILAELSD